MGSQTRKRKRKAETRPRPKSTLPPSVAIIETLDTIGRSDGELKIELRSIEGTPFVYISTWSTTGRRESGVSVRLREVERVAIVLGKIDPGAIWRAQRRQQRPQLAPGEHPRNPDYDPPAVIDPTLVPPWEGPDQFVQG